MGKRLGFVLSATGIGFVIFGSMALKPGEGIEALGIEEVGSMTRMVVIGIGVVAAFFGTALLLADVRRDDSGKNKGVKKDNPTRVRLVGVVVTVGSLGLPYIKTPLEVGVDRTGQSLVGILDALRTGGEVDFVLLFLMSVVFMGGSVSILHHFGGYIILFGTAFYSYLTAEVLGMGLGQVVLNEFELGLYIAVGGAVIIVGSSVMSYETVDRDRTFIGGRRK